MVTRSQDGATSPAESHEGRATSAHPRWTRRFVHLSPLLQASNVDCLLSLRTVDPAARQKIEQRIAQGRDQLSLCAEEGRRLGELDREIKKEQNAHKEAMVRLFTRPTLSLLFATPPRLTR